MALKDRLNTKKTQTKAVKEVKDIAEIYTSLDEKQSVEFNIPIGQLTKKILNVNDNAHLGAIVKEFAKFLDSLSDSDTALSLNGNFDIGKKALIACLLANIIEEKPAAPVVNEQVAEEKPQEAEESKLIKKRKTLREKLKKVRLEED